MKNKATDGEQEKLKNQEEGEVQKAAETVEAVRAVETAESAEPIKAADEAAEEKPTEAAEEKAEKTGKKELSGKKLLVHNIIVNTVFVIILALAIFVLAMVIVARVQNKNVSFFGYSFAIVVTDSMEPEIMTGSLIVIKECEISEDLLYKNVVFTKLSGDLAGESIVHRVEAVEVIDGQIYLTTKGVNNLIADTELVTAENFIGLCVASSYAAGKAANFLITYGVPILIAIIAVPVIIKLSIYIYKNSKPDPEEPEE